MTGEISTVKKLGGGKLEIKYEDRNFKEAYRDEYTNEILPTHLIRASIKEELNYFNERLGDHGDQQGQRLRRREGRSLSMGSMQ